MERVQYCTRCGHEFTEEDFEEKICLMCGEPIPAVGEENLPETETAAEDPASEPAAPEVVEWVTDGEFVVCPLCRASYYADEMPEVCERCMQDEERRHTVWVLPEKTAGFFLTYTDGGTRIPLSDGLILGRAATSCLEDKIYVSRRHASIHIGDGALSILDEHSTNGTFVNGRRLIPGTAQNLQAGDIVELDRERFAVVRE